MNHQKIKFSILGMNLFGCKFCEKNEKGEEVCDRKNFDSLLWSLVTVFQVRKPN
jgi:voltage-dependent calcium channel T type alpha-1G